MRRWTMMEYSLAAFLAIYVTGLIVMAVKR